MLFGLIADGIFCFIRGNCSNIVGVLQAAELEFFVWQSGFWYFIQITKERIEIMSEQKKERKKIDKKTLIGGVALAVLTSTLIILYSVFGVKPVAGSKDITIEVINKANQSTVYELSTDAEFLRQAMEEAEGLTFEAADGMVLTVNGETADYSVDASYWAFYVNDGYCNYGIDTQPVMDGDSFSIQYTVSQ